MAAHRFYDTEQDRHDDYDPAEKEECERLADEQADIMLGDIGSEPEEEEPTVREVTAFRERAVRVGT